jgi:uncharacterized membrane protein
LVVGALAGLLVATLIGLAVLWPSGERPHVGRVLTGDIDSAEVLSVKPAYCPSEGRPGCKQVVIKLLSGSDKGNKSFLDIPGDEAAPKLGAGDEIRVLYSGFNAKQGSADVADAPYSFVDFERRAPIEILFVIFAVLVVVLGRRAGALSLIAVILGLLVITKFVVPAIVQDESPFAVGLVGSFAVMFVSIVVTYGAGVKSLAALLGTAVSLVLTVVLGLIFVHAAHITGTSSEQATLLKSAQAGISLQGLVLAGIVIGALGVLSDVTVSQSSTVLALKRANPRQGLRELYREGVAVGRDHLAATVSTLVFAYAGAALPILLIFYTQRTGLGEAINREDIATEVVATLVGSIGLITAVPLTTLVASVLADRLPAGLLPAEEHAHAH